MVKMAFPQKISPRVTKVAFTLACLVPFGWVVYRLVTGDLGASPAEHANHKFGLIALRLLAANLIWGALIALDLMPKASRRYVYLRRHLGVVTFVYVLGHFAFYYLKEGDLAVATTQLFTKTYLIVGLVALSILLVLTVTSADWAVRRMRARWKTLHRAVYVALALSVLHFALIEKKDWTEALPYLAPLGLLYIIRLAKFARAPRRRPVR